MITRPIVAITGGRKDIKPGQGVGRNNILIPSPVQMSQFLRLLGEFHPAEVRHGAAIGTDRYVGFFLEKWKNGCWDDGQTGSSRGRGQVYYRFSYLVNVFPIDPALDGEWPTAGHKRNLRMLMAEPGVDVLVAFPGGAGTENCIDQAIQATNDGRGQVTVYKWRGDREKGEFVKIYGQRGDDNGNR